MRIGCTLLALAPRNWLNTFPDTMATKKRIGRRVAEPASASDY